MGGMGPVHLSQVRSPARPEPNLPSAVEGLHSYTIYQNVAISRPPRTPQAPLLPVLAGRRGAYVVPLGCHDLHPTGKKKDKKKYYRHSIRPGQVQEITMECIMAKYSGAEALRKAIGGMLPKNRCGRLDWRG
ncbi:hypothetical protein BDD12DRAFT_980342 [Trichophaea hybrida]|nr:hypothetical protein BDD12DRAFT_980342 [Trichophaea hybrida]